MKVINLWVCNMASPEKVLLAILVSFHLPLLHGVQAIPDCQSRLDLVLVVDSSLSVGASNFTKVTSFLESLISYLPIQEDAVRVSLVRYASKVHVISYLNQDMEKADKLAAVSSMQFRPGTTHTHAALQLTRESVLTPEHGDRPDVANLVILMTDGTSSIPTLTVRESSLLKENQQLKVFVIGIGRSVNDTELSVMASRPEMIYKLSDFSQLTDIVDKLAKFSCSDMEESSIQELVEWHEAGPQTLVLLTTKKLVLPTTETPLLPTFETTSSSSLQPTSFSLVESSSSSSAERTIFLSSEITSPYLADTSSSLSKLLTSSSAEILSSSSAETMLLRSEETTRVIIAETTNSSLVKTAHSSPALSTISALPDQTTSALLTTKSSASSQTTARTSTSTTSPPVSTSTSVTTSPGTTTSSHQAFRSVVNASLTTKVFSGQFNRTERKLLFTKEETDSPVDEESPRVMPVSISKEDNISKPEVFENASKTNSTQIDPSLISSTLSPFSSPYFVNLVNHSIVFSNIDNVRDNFSISSPSVERSIALLDSSSLSVSNDRVWSGSQSTEAHSTRELSTESATITSSTADTTTQNYERNTTLKSTSFLMEYNGTDSLNTSASISTATTLENQHKNQTTFVYNETASPATNYTYSLSLYKIATSPPDITTSKNIFSVTRNSTIQTSTTVKDSQNLTSIVFFTTSTDHTASTQFSTGDLKKHLLSQSTKTPPKQSSATTPYNLNLKSSKQSKMFSKLSPTTSSTTMMSTQAPATSSTSVFTSRTSPDTKTQKTTIILPFTTSSIPNITNTSDSVLLVNTSTKVTLNTTQAESTTPVHITKLKRTNSWTYRPNRKSTTSKDRLLLINQTLPTANGVEGGPTILEDYHPTQTGGDHRSRDLYIFVAAGSVGAVIVTAVGSCIVLLLRRKQNSVTSGEV